MDNQYVETNNQLKKAYMEWLDELKIKYPEFLGDTYSNPYYSCVPKNWFSSDIRILIVGEEGYGAWGRGKSEGVRPDEIEKNQTFCWSSLASYLEDGNTEYDLYPCAELYPNINSPFWRRARELRKYGICAWSNIDKIHKLRNGKCALSKAERIKLHSLQTKILNKEIEILNPSHIVFFGWYGISLEHELPSIFKELYPKGLGDDSLWKGNVVNIKNDGKNYLFTYHPGWRNQPEGYEEKIMLQFKKL